MPGALPERPVEILDEVRLGEVQFDLAVQLGHDESEQVGGGDPYRRFFLPP